MYTPTKEELEELEFEVIHPECFYVYECRDFSKEELDSYVWIQFSNYKKPRWSISYGCWDIYTRNFYPRSLSDLKTIIEMFKPNNQL